MSAVDIQIEIASKDDAAKILAIQKAAFLGQAKIYDNYALPPLTESLESIVKEFDNKIFLKALIKGEIIGALGFNHAKGQVTIERIAVKPDYQNKGIGTALLTKVEAMVPKAIAYSLFTGNISARNIHLYEKAGYRVTGQKTSEQGIDLLYMEKRP